MTGCKGEGSCTDGEWMQKHHRKGNRGWPEEGKGTELGVHLYSTVKCKTLMVEKSDEI